jgi:hypothetical protein
MLNLIISKKITAAIQRFFAHRGHSIMKLLSTTIIIIYLLMPFSVKPFAATSIVNPATYEPVIKSTPKISFKQSKSLIEKNIGRRLTFKEKVALRLHPLFHHKQKVNNGNAKTNAVLGFIFSIAGLFIPLLFIPGLILSNNALKQEKENPGVLTPSQLTLAKIGKIVSIAGIILLAIAVIVIVIAIAGGGFAAL